MGKFYQRKSPRLQGYDYSQSGSYFVTICTYDRHAYFGNIRNGEMEANALADIAIQCWQEIPDHYLTVELDYFIIMPNHVHGIVVLDDDSPKLGTIIGTYKAAVTRHARQLQIRDTIWQKGYHDHIIRNTESLNEIRQYILYNPAKWEEDRYYAQIGE